jgi:hypothetical protein
MCEEQTVKKILFTVKSPVYVYLFFEGVQVQYIILNAHFFTFFLINSISGLTTVICHYWIGRYEIQQINDQQNDYQLNGLAIMEFKFNKETNPF